MKKILVLMAAVLLVFGLSACSSTDAELEEIVLCLDWTPNTNHTGFYVADKLGYYEQAGLKVTIVQPPEDGAELMTAAGQAQFGISFQDSVASAFAQEEPLGITAVAAILQHNTSGIITRKGEGGSRPSGLEGMRYSTWNGAIETAMMKYIMEKDSADFGKLQLLPNVVTNEAEALKNKDTDAIWIYYAWAGVSCELSGLDFDFLSFTDIDEVFDYYTPIIVANNSFLSEKPEIAKAFLKATKAGYEYAVENPDQAAQMLIEGDTTGSLADSAELVTESQRWISKQYIADADSWGYIEAERWNRFYDWLYENSLIEKNISGTGFSNNYLTK